MDNSKSLMDLNIDLSDILQDTPGFSTKSIHPADDLCPTTGGYNFIDLSVTFKQAIPGKPIGEKTNSKQGHIAQKKLENTIASLEQAKHAIVMPSGFGALSCVLWLLKPEDHLIHLDDTYCGTLRYVNSVATTIPLFTTSGVDFSDLKNLEKAIRPNTKLVLMETPTNPNLIVYDIEKIAKFCKERGILTVIDNTMASPYLQNPLNLGIDIVWTSGSKYLGGHSDVIIGYIATNDTEKYKKMRTFAEEHGSIPGPFDCYIANRGLKTLKLRIREQCKNAMLIARYLEKHPKIEKVLYPGLESHPQYDIVKKQMRGFGGVMTFYIKGDINQAKIVLSNLKYITLAESFGAVESLIESPAVMTHWFATREQREQLGISDNMIRLSVGIEDVEDLIEDLEHALSLI